MKLLLTYSLLFPHLCSVSDHCSPLFLQLPLQRKYLDRGYQQACRQELGKPAAAQGERKAQTSAPSMICFHLAHFSVLLVSLPGVKHITWNGHLQPCSSWRDQAQTEGVPEPPALTALTHDKNRPNHVLENLLTFMVNNLYFL